MHCNRIIPTVKLKMTETTNCLDETTIIKGALLKTHDQNNHLTGRLLQRRRLLNQSKSEAVTLPEIDSKAEYHDGFSNKTALMDTVYRVCLIACTYLLASTALTILGGFYLPIYGLGPIEMAVLNALSIVFFVVIMLPFALFSAYCLRYDHESPVQERIFDLEVSSENSIELSMAAMESLPGSRLKCVDTSRGIIEYVGSGSRKFGPQEVSIHLESLSPQLTRFIVTSHPKLSAIQYLLFGFTLAVDGEKNKRNVDGITEFLTQCAQ